jgi:glycerol dehydrogenase-like iron-containing ADH family enzyme
MIDIFPAPKRYVQKPGLLDEIGAFLPELGRRPLVLADETVHAIIAPYFEPCRFPSGFSPRFVRFGRECSFAEIARLVRVAAEERADAVVGTGGGKAIDAARVAAQRLDLPLVALPTSAATCSACSSLSVIYEDGIRQDTLYGKSAELVLADSAVIAAAPARLLAAGIGDALVKFYEGSPTFERTADPRPSLQAAYNLSVQVRDGILARALEAKQDADAGRITPAVEAMIETNILMAGVIGGIGGATFRVALAHGLLYGMTVLPAVRRRLHGEVVAYGLIVQLCLEEKSGEARRLIPLLRGLGLPLTLDEIGVAGLEDPLFAEGLRRTCAPGASAHNLSVPVTEASLLAAIHAAQKLTARF